MTRSLEWESTLTDKRIEYAYGLTKKMIEARNDSWAEIGLRAVRQGDSKILRALEKMAESTNKLQEEQIGQLMRSMSASHGETLGTTEHQLCREAYVLAQKGPQAEGGKLVDRRVHFKWIYGAAAWLCGYNP